MSKKNIIVIGSESATQAAIAKARQFDEHARIIWVKLSPFWHLEDFAHYLKDPLLLDEKLKNLEQFIERYDVEVCHNVQASIDVDARLILLKSKKSNKRIHFDSMIFSGDAFKTAVPMDSPKVCGFSTTEDLEKIWQAKKNGAKEAVVLGLTIEGIKASLALKDLGFLVTLIDEKKSLPFSLHFSEEILSRFSQDISVLNGEINEIYEGERLEVAHSKGIIEADLVVVGQKAKPDLSMLIEAGALVNDGIQIDDQLLCTLPNIYACGSTVQVPTMGAKSFNALKTAQIAGFNAVSENKQVLNLSCRTEFLEVKNKFFARTGLTELEAFKLFQRDNVVITTVYQNEMCLRIVVDKTKERIIGAEVFGDRGVKRRVDLLTMAISQEFSLKMLLDLDMVDEDGFELDPLKEAALRAHMALVKNVNVISSDHLALWLLSNKSFSLINVDKEPLGKKALHLPLEEIRKRLKEMETSLPIVLYSKSGHESFLAQQALGQRGLNTYHLDGGFLAWQILSKEVE